ncbi:MAG: LamG domain-containing protein [Flavihumibacter sp.]|nr:LamG domain-containing protein [Flavihumibacter sp.]
MQKIKSLFGVILTFTLFISLGTKMSSCTKEVIVRDTVIIKDTITRVDTFPCTDLKEGLVAWYKFTGGSLKDSSGYNNDIVFSNATPTSDRFGKTNNAYLFNGGSYMRVNNSASLNPTRITLVGIVKFNDFYRGAYGQNQIIKKGFRDQNDGIYGLRVGASDAGGSVDTTKEIGYGYYGNNQFDQISAADRVNYIKTNQWKIFVFTYNGIDAKYYVDGVLRETKTGVVGFTPNTDGLFIGRAENPSYPFWLTGVIDEIRIYNRALCDCDIKELNKLKN